LPHSAATSPAPAYLPHGRQAFASPGLRPHLTRQSTHSRFERSKKFDDVESAALLLHFVSIGGCWKQVEKRVLSFSRIFMRFNYLD
jgi:hypothetical protein